MFFRVPDRLSVTRRAVESEDFELAQKLKQQEQDSQFQLGKKVNHQWIGILINGFYCDL